jgi:hypothetical protein
LFVVCSQSGNDPHEDLSQILPQDKFESTTFYILANFHSFAKTIELQLGQKIKSFQLLVFLNL